MSVSHTWKHPPTTGGLCSIFCSFFCFLGLFFLGLSLLSAFCSFCSFLLGSVFLSVVSSSTESSNSSSSMNILGLLKVSGDGFCLGMLTLLSVLTVFVTTWAFEGRTLFLFSWIFAFWDRRVSDCCVWRL